MTHYQERLEEDLKRIRDHVGELSERVETALDDAVRALLTQDKDLAYRTVLRDSPINRISRAIDALCHAFIARHLPSAGHLRLISATIRANVALERVGDYAVTICREGIQLPGPPGERLSQNLDNLSGEVRNLLRQAVQSFNESNADLAKALVPLIDRIEDMMDGLYTDVFNAEEVTNPRSLTASFVVFSLLKRVSDQAKNVCNQTIFAVSGEAKRAKVYQILFVDRGNDTYSQMAAALARKAFPGCGQYQCAGLDPAARADASVVEFLQEHGAPSNFNTQGLERLTRDLSNIDVVISLEGPLDDYFKQLPFHTTGLQWTLPEFDQGGVEAVYRELMPMIEDLMVLLAGEGAD